MVEFTPLLDAKVRATFSVTLVHQPQPGVTLPISTVSVVGDFNDWDGQKNPLQLDSSDVREGKEYRKFVGEAIIEAGFIHHYHFLVDGVHRWADPDNPRKIPNARGGEDSILEAPMQELHPPPAQEQPPKKRVAKAAAKRPEAGLGSPEERLSEAAGISRATAAAKKTAGEKIVPLARAVRLDPYELNYRLALIEALREAGRLKDATAECRKALALWPDEPRVALLLGETLLEDGQLEEARTQLSRVPETGRPGRQRAFDLVEVTIRQAGGPEDWGKVLEGLEKLDVDQATVGLFCEKCLKVLVEAESAEVTTSLRSLIDKKLSCFKGHPARALFERVATFEPAAVLKNDGTSPPPGDLIAGDFGGKRSADLESFVKAFRLSNAPVDGDGGPASRLGGIAGWRQILRSYGKRWPDLVDAYICQLDRWGREAYKGKNLQLAGVLWSEVERLDPVNPAVLQNLALVYTRLKDERGYEWYWSRLARTLIFHCEMLPESETFSRLLAEKHQTFVDGLQKATPLAADWRQMLKLGAQLARESVSLLAIRQIAFKNPLFRGGICREDYGGPDERHQKLLLASASLGEWLKLTAEWAGLPKQGSALVDLREERLNEAVELVKEGGPALRRSYEDERAAFKAHRGQAAQQFLNLLAVLQQVSEKAGVLGPAERTDGLDVARAVMSFPHELIKPALLEMKAGLKPDSNVRELATNYAVLPWFAPAQRDFEQKRYDRALENFLAVQSVAPDLLTGWFYVAQCYAALGRFSEAFDTAKKALKKCPGDDPMREHLTKAIPQILSAWAGPLMQKEDWLEARKILAKGASAGFRDARITFYEALCLARAGKVADGQNVAKQALALAQKAGDKPLEKEIQDFIPQIPILLISSDLAQAQTAMNKKKWREALPILEQAVTKAPASAFARFLKAVCLFNVSEIEKADDEAREGLKHADGPGLEQIKTQLQQIVTAASNHRQAVANKRKAEVLNPMFAAMKKAHWRQAKELSEKAFIEYPFDEHVRYYRALCLFQACMAELKSHGPFRYRSDAEGFLFPRIAEAKAVLYRSSGLNPFLKKPASLLADLVPSLEDFGGTGDKDLGFIDHELRKAAEQLDQAMDGVLAQLKENPY